MAKFTVELSEKQLKEVAEELAYRFIDEYDEGILKEVGYSSQKALVKMIAGHEQFHRAIEKAVETLIEDVIYDGDLSDRLNDGTDLLFMNELYVKADKICDERLAVDRANILKEKVAQAKKLLKSEGYAVSKV